MLKNYLKIAWRNLVQNKSYALINIGGLAIALAVFLVITLFVRHELSYDEFFSDSENIYRVLMATGEKSNQIQNRIPEVIADELKDIYPEVKESVRVRPPGRDRLLKGKESLYTSGWAEVGPSFFSIFDFKFIAGSKSNALSEPKNVVLTTELAQKLFGKTNVVDQTITMEKGNIFTITGVIENPPSNTHFSNFDAFSYRKKVKRKRWTTLWNHWTNITYLQLHDGALASSLREKLPSYVEKHKNLPNGMKGEGYRLILQNITGIHLYPNGPERTSSRWFYIQVLMFVAGLILLVACINYMNLATARSAGRAREIGIRKAVGADKGQLITQVLMESFLTCLFAFGVSFLLVELLHPMTKHYFDINLSSLYELSWGWIGMLTGLLLLITLLSGGYAAFYLSSFYPSDVLRGNRLASGRGSVRLRKMLVIAQFAISIAIVIATLLISKQMDYIRTERLDGVDDQIVVIRNNSDDLWPQFDVFKNKMLESESIKYVSAGTLPTQLGMTASFPVDGKQVQINYMRVEYDYFKTMGLEMVKGRSFDVDRSQDTVSSVIYNEAAASAVKYDKTMGKQVSHTRDKLIGIVENFHAHTLFDPIQPVGIKIMDPDHQELNNVLVRLKEGEINTGLEHIRQTWPEFVPAYPLNYTFLSDILDRNYQPEIRMAKIFNVFSVFTILIACLGLLGLAAYSAERRTKEIAIRKVVGATITQIVGRLNKDFMKLVGVGFVIAVPIGWYAIRQWLQRFAYRTDINGWVFVIAGGSAIMIALITVSWQSIQAALTNPAESIRNE